MSKYLLKHIGINEHKENNKKSLLQNNTDYKAIVDILQIFRDGYIEKNKEKVDEFVASVFEDSDATTILGTSTGELILGTEEVKILIDEDWEYWGDVDLDVENAHITINKDKAWFCTSGTAKYTFEDNEKRYDSYLEFIKKKINDDTMNAKQKAAFLNWSLLLTYYQRSGTKREEFWPVHLSCFLRKMDGQWRITNGHFSISQPDFPDERLDESSEYITNQEEQNKLAAEFSVNKMNSKLELFMNNLSKDLYVSNQTDILPIETYFKSSGACVLGPKKTCYHGIEQINNYFVNESNSNVSLDFDHAIASKIDNFYYVTITGVIEKETNEKEIYKKMIKEILELAKADMPSERKIFQIQRQLAYVIKENAISDCYTYPIRMTAVIENQNGNLKLDNLHISHPSYWIFEGKLDLDSII